MLTDGDGLLDQEVQILGDGGTKTYQKNQSPFQFKTNRLHTVGTEDADDLASGQVLDLSNSMGVTEEDTDLGWGQTLLGEFDDKFVDFLGRGLQPAWGTTAIGDGGSRNTLTINELEWMLVDKRIPFRMHTTHLVKI
jgi:hypothetical protein